jgi:hypothetical protein
MRRLVVILAAVLVASLIVVVRPAAGATQQFLWYDGLVTHTERAYATPTQTAQTPYSWYSPVNYAAGTVYTRINVVDKPSTKKLWLQLCVWRNSFKEESCSSRREISTEGVYYFNFGTPNNWWKLNGTWSWGTPFSPTRIMLKDPNTGKLMQVYNCGAYCSTSSAVAGHIPITMDASSIVVASGATLAPPAKWAGCPFPGCGGGTATTTSSSTSTTVASGTKKVAMIVGNASSLPPKDVPIRSRLVNALGRQVVLVDDDAVTSTALGGASLVLVSSSVVPSKIPSWLASHPVPILNAEAYIQTKLKMASSQGELAGKTSLEMRVPSTDPMAAGKTGTVVVQGTVPMATGKPVSSATIVARVPGTTGGSVYRIAAGAALTSGSAAAKRAAFFFSYDSPPTVTSNGWALFDSAVKWLAP